MRAMDTQYTIKKAMVLEGIGLHSGRVVRMEVLPAPVDHGVVFYRTDVAADEAAVPASYALVSETMLGTVIENSHGVKVQTVEHLMAALWGLGIDNALVKIDAPEVPIMDGSSKDFIEFLEPVGRTAQHAPRQYIEVLKPISVMEGQSSMSIRPCNGLVIDIEIGYPHPLIEKQKAVYDFRESTFKETLAEARTFGFKADIEHLRKLGLTLGGSLNNAIVLDERGIMNEGGLRFTDEFVRHKALDCVGDFFLAGGRLLGHVVANKPGHRMNNLLLRELFEDKEAWRMVKHVPASKAHASEPMQEDYSPVSGLAYVPVSTR